MKNKKNFGLIVFLIASYVSSVQAASLADVIRIEAYNQCQLSGPPNCSNNIEIPLMNAMYSGCYLEIERQFEAEGCQNVPNLCQSIVQRALSCISNQLRKTEGY